MWRGTDAVQKAVELARCLQRLGTGRASTGIAWVDRGGIRMDKALVPPDEYTPPQVKARVAIAHNRLPSVGKVSLSNCHPFLSCDGSFAFIHNGTFLAYNLVRVLLNGKHEIKGETDSEVLAHMFCEYGERIGWVKLAQSLPPFQRIIMLFKDGSVLGREVYMHIGEDGYYLANESSVLRDLYGGKVYRVDGVVTIRGREMKVEGDMREEKHFPRYVWDDWKEDRKEDWRGYRDRWWGWW